MESPEFLRFLSLDEVNSILQSKPEDLNKVINWLRSFGIDTYEVANSNDMIKVHTTVEKAEKLLSAKFEVFQAKNKQVIRTRSYSLPTDIAECIDFIGGTTDFPARSTLKHSTKSNAPNFGTTPAVIKEQYDVKDKGSNPNNLQGIASFLDQFISEDDLKDFFDDFSYPQYKVQKIIGPNDPQKPGDEASLDIQYIMSIGEAIPTWVWSTAGRHEKQEPWLDWLFAVSNATLIPKLFSVSYGEPEEEITTAYQLRVGVEFQKLGARGVSLLYASGDSGPDCSKDCKKFRPGFPCGSPYVTAVGATTLDSNKGTETAAGFSGGGFSELHAQPAYQKKAVTTFLTRTKTPKSYFKAEGRAFPDVSALGTTFQIRCGGSQNWVDGTSASAPAFAGIMSLINDHRLTKGLPQLGFANPFLYWAYEQDPTAFTDITEGTAQFGCCPVGFDCVPGWDPITGLGTPNYPKLLALALKYKPKA